MGVLACSCGSTIGDVIDLRALIQHAAQWPNVVASEVVDFACFPDAITHLQRRILDANLNHVVIAACSNRTHEALFHRMMRMAGLNPYLLELVNLREQCTRVHQQQSALANRKARSWCASLSGGC